MNLPNTLTLGRIFLVPVLVVVLLTQFEGRSVFGVPKEIVGALVFTVAALTDWLDGYLARRRRQVTTLGQLLDPLADKLLITAALVSLVQMGLAPAWMAAVIILRELAVTGLRSIAQSRGITMPSSSLGKVKMGFQVAAVLLLLVGSVTVWELLSLGKAALWIVMALAIISAVDYATRFSATVAPAEAVSGRVTGGGAPVREKRAGGA